MKPITTSVYTFCDLIDGGFLYVDKTAAIHALIRNYKGLYFLARPRRFGKSLLGHLGQPTVTAIQTLLKQFYAVIKTTESHQRFVLITGVSKFTKVSIFSDLNNLTDLTDLTMDPRTATLLGYTQQELEAAFPDYIERLAGAISKNRTETW